MDIDIKRFPRDLRGEVLLCRKKYETFRRMVIRQPGYTVNWPLLEKAWGLSLLWHCTGGVPRYRPQEVYVTHGRPILEKLTGLRCNTNILAAALLRDVLTTGAASYETIRGHFPKEVAQLVASIRDAKQMLTVWTQDSPADFAQGLMGKISPEFRRETFLILFAEQEQVLKARHDPQALAQVLCITERVFLPIARSLGSTYCETALGGLWLERHPTVSASPILQTIYSQKNYAIQFNYQQYERFDRRFFAALDTQDILSRPPYNPHAPHPANSGADYRRLLSPYELLRQAESGKDPTQWDLWEVLLTYPDRYRYNVVKHFLDMYQGKPPRHCFAPLSNDFFLAYAGSSDHSVTLRLTDSLGYNYRIVLVAGSELDAHFFGSSASRRAISEEFPFDDNARPQISVRSYAPRGHQLRVHNHLVPAGSTALDLALRSDPMVGLTARGVWIKHPDPGNTEPILPSETDCKDPLETVLREGDVLFFDTPYDPEGEPISRGDILVGLDSLLKVHTQQGKQCLIEYLRDPDAFLTRAKVSFRRLD